MTDNHASACTEKETQMTDSPTVEERAGAFASKLIRRIFLLATVAVIAIALFGTIGPLPPVAVVGLAFGGDMVAFVFLATTKEDA